MTTFNTEGNHSILASYSGTANFGSSSGSLIQRVDNHTVVNGNEFCNTGSIAINDSGSVPTPAAPYPSNIFVSGLAGTISTVTLQLNNLSHPRSDDLDLLLVGPTGAQLIVMSDSGGLTAASNVNLNLADAGASLLPDATALSSGTFKPTNYDTLETFPASAPAGPYNNPAPAGAATFSSVFANTNPNGAWSLYLVDDSSGGVGASNIAGGWCLTFTLNAPDLTIAKTHSGDFTQGQIGATYSINVTNNGPANTSGTVTVIDTLPVGLTATDLAGIGWSCNVGTLTCTRSDVLLAGSSYPAITLTVDVAGNAAANLINTATVSGGGDASPGNNTANDSTTVSQPTRVWTTEGSNGTVDEDSTAIVALSNFAAGLQPGKTGVGTLRYNVTATGGISRFCPATSSNILIRFRDSDASGTAAQLLLTIHRSSIATGGNTTIFTFDSNASALPLGTAFQTHSATAPIDFDFANNIYWIEAQISSSDPNALVHLGSIKIFESGGTTCP